MEIKNLTHAGVHGKWIPNAKWERIMELIEHNNALIRELKGELEQ